jgi:hypothetical protein
MSSRITGQGIEYMSHRNFGGILSKQVHSDAFRGLKNKTQALGKKVFSAVLQEK